MKAKVTQTAVVKEMLQKGIKVTGSNAYQITKLKAGVGTLNLHKIISSLRKSGMKIKEKWMYNKETKCNYKQFYL